MSIDVRFFASLREQLGASNVLIESADVTDVHSVWCQSTDDAELPPNTLCAINQNYANLNDAVKEGDEVAFFPPVTGG